MTWEVTVPITVAIIGVIVAIIKYGPLLNRKQSGAPDASSIAKDIKTLLEETHDLHRWHDIRDDDGVKVWYIKKSLQEDIAALHRIITTMTQVSERLESEVHELADKIKHERGK